MSCLFQINMADTLDASISQLICEVEKGPETPWIKWAVKVLVPVWICMMFYIIWALLGKLEEVSDY